MNSSVDSQQSPNSWDRHTKDSDADAEDESPPLTDVSDMESICSGDERKTSEFLQSLMVRDGIGSTLDSAGNPLSAPMLPTEADTNGNGFDVSDDVNRELSPLVVPNHQPVLPVIQIHNGEPIPVDVLAYSYYLDARAKNPIKQQCAGIPEVWADGRQELCETLPYFRAYQSSAYTFTNKARGYLFDQSSRPRDYIDTEVVVSSCGGGMVKSKTDGSLMFEGSGMRSKSDLRALKQCIEGQEPVVVISGDRNPTLSVSLPFAYNVLGWFKPTESWSEKFNGRPVDRYRLEILNRHKPSWWRAVGVESLPTLGQSQPSGKLPPPVYCQCLLCGQASPQVYINGWMCLNKTCIGFWKYPVVDSNDGIDPDEATLMYDARFLRQHTDWQMEVPPHPLGPILYDDYFAILKEDSHPTSRFAWKGIVCSNCGRCNSRILWNGWICGNPFCQKEMLMEITPIRAVELRDFSLPVTGMWPIARDLVHPDVHREMLAMGRYKVIKYTIPGVDGFISHFLSHQAINSELNGPDSMWTELQTRDLGLSRCRLPSRLRGGMLTQHFAVNFGMPYKYVSAPQTRSFEEGGWVIQEIRDRLNWAAGKMIGDSHQDINEILTVGYFEDQAMSYHDDGEPGVGSTIASISIGYTGKMKFRLKEEVYHGITENYVFSPCQPIKGCKSYLARKNALDELNAIPDPAQRQARAREIVTELGLDRKGAPPVLLGLHLAHGDIVVMEGHDIQRYCKHMVTHEGKLRFGITGRTISESEMPSSAGMSNPNLGPTAPGVAPMLPAHNWQSHADLPAQPEADATDPAPTDDPSELFHTPSSVPPTSDFDSNVDPALQSGFSGDGTSA